MTMHSLFNRSLYRSCISGDLSDLQGRVRLVRRELTAFQGSSAMKLREIGEDRLLDQLCLIFRSEKQSSHGPGDDCAVVETRDRRNSLVLKTDCVVAGVHFLPTADRARRRLESNDASAQRFRRNIGRASICADHSITSRANRRSNG